MKKSRLQTWAWVGLLGAMLCAAGGFAAPQHKMQIKPGPSTHKYPRSARGEADMADGQIKSVRCHGRTLDMTFDDSDSLLQLYSDDYFQVDFSAINFTPQGTLNPCKSIQGMYARVHFYHIKGHPKVGELTSVELRK